jgi:hypothetical protein
LILGASEPVRSAARIIVILSVVATASAMSASAVDREMFVKRFFSMIEDEVFGVELTSGDGQY